LYSQCEEDLDKEGRNKILEDLQKSLTEYDVFEYFNAQPTIFKDYDHLVIAKDHTSTVIGLIGVKCFENEGIKFLYFWTALINEKYHGTLLIFHLYQWLLEKVFLKEGFINILSTKTYNPIVYNIFLKNKKIMGEKVNIYPLITNDDTSNASIVNIAQKVFNTICPTLELELDTGRVVGGQGVLSPNFFPYLPDSKDNTVNEHFKENLTRDDQILCVMQILDESDFKNRLRI
jgi:hypothetical protein